jgi:transposase
MNTMAEDGLVCGIDTHADSMTVAVCEATGRVVAVASFETNAAGHRRLMGWLQSHGEVTEAGVEGTSSYGKPTVRVLAEAGVRVWEVIRPNRQVRRRYGKSDPTDAVAAARAVISGEADAVPKSGDGSIEAIRVLQVARISAIKARTQAANQIKDLIVTAPIELRDRLRPLSTRQRVDICARFRPDTPLKRALRILARRHQALTTEIVELTAQISQLIQATAPTLLALPGVGPDVAAKLLIAAGDNPHRIRNEAAFAALCGASPVDASSGKQQRHRLNRGGNRAANNALWRIALVRMSHDPETRAYVQRRTADGKTKPEIIRCLKRYIARQIHHTILQDLPHLT